MLERKGVVMRGLISVSDKSGLEWFAKELEKLHIEIISTGGTEKLLKKNSIAVKSVSDVSGFPECFDGGIGFG